MNDVHPAKVNIQILNKHQHRYKSYVQIILIAINLSLSNFYFGYSLVYISTIEFETIIRIFSITMPTEMARGILTGCVPIGAGIGALTGKKLIHLFSRRNFVLGINSIAIVAGLLIYINRMEILIIIRLIQGICVGLYTAIIPLYITELCPYQISSSTGPFTQIFCSSGTTTAYLFYFILTLAISEQNSGSIWYFVFGFPLIPLIIQTIVLLFVFPYETPKYFLLHHQKNKARALIKQIYKAQFVQIILHEKIQDLSLGKIKQVQKAKQKVRTEQPGVPIPTLRMSSKISVSSALSGVQIQEPPTSSMAIFTAVHLMILRQFSGINAVVAYGGEIIKEAAPNLRTIVPIVLNFEVALGATVAMCVLHRFGRRTLLQGGTLVLGFSLLFISVGFFILSQSKNPATVLIIFGLVIFNFTFGLTFGAIIWSYVSEIVEPSYTIFATMITWVFASIIIVLFPILKSSLFGGNPAVLFLFFCIWTLVSFVINHIVLVETKDKTGRQIHQDYMDLKGFSCIKKRDLVLQKTQSQLLDINSLNPWRKKVQKQEDKKVAQKNIPQDIMMNNLIIGKQIKTNQNTQPGKSRQQKITNMQIKIKRMQAKP